MKNKKDNMKAVGFSSTEKEAMQFNKNCLITKILSRKGANWGEIALNMNLVI